MTTYAIYDTANMRKRLIAGGFASGADAYAHLVAIRDITFGEEDADHPGCFDAFEGKTGSIYAVEPAKEA